MRILAIADIHGATEVYEWIPGAIADYEVDALILAGDILLGGWEEEQCQQAETFIIPLLKSLSISVFFVMGNDDHIELNPEDEKIRSAHDRRLDFGSYNVVGYQYSPPFIGSCHEKPESEIAIDLRKLESLLDSNTILITHTPAHGYVDRIYSGYNVGSKALAECLKRNSVLCHIHGHIHHSFGRADNHFNVAAGGRRRAMIIDLPLLSHRAITG
jgi:Icc-related predicted phosphoesterase